HQVRVYLQGVCLKVPQIRSRTVPDLAADYESTSAARKNFWEMFDAVIRGKEVTIRRGEETAAVMSAGGRRSRWLRTVEPRTDVLSEEGRWIVLLSGRPCVCGGDGRRRDRRPCADVARVRAGWGGTAAPGA